MKARVLILHHNFPAQFRFIALDLARNGHDVVFEECNYVGALRALGKSLSRNIRLGLRALRWSRMRCSLPTCNEAIRDEGWCPDVVISHSGGAVGLR